MALIHQVYDTDAHFKIDPVTRVIKNASSGKNVLIQGDHNSERFTFELPKLIDGHDMSKCNSVQVHYINIDSTDKSKCSADTYNVDDLRTSPEDENVVICSWLISGNATRYAGSLAFLLKFKCIDVDGSVSYVWNTARYNSISISNGLDNGESIAEEYSDILAQWEARISALENGEVGGSANGYYSTTREELAVTLGKENAVPNDVTSAAVWGLYNALMAKYPDRVQKNTLKSNDGTFTNYEYVISTGDWNSAGHFYGYQMDTDIKKPKYLITSGMHGYERQSILFVYRFIRDVVEGHNVPQLFREGCAIKVIPIVNPYSLDFRDDDGNPIRFNENGVDINNNFDHNWATEDDGRGGTHPESENETQVVANWLRDNTDAAGYFDCHCHAGYPDELLWVYGGREDDDEYYKTEKKIAFRGVDRVVPFWRDVLGYDTNATKIYTSLSVSGGEGTAFTYARMILGIPSLALEPRAITPEVKDENPVGYQRVIVPEIVAEGAEVIGNILIEFYENYVASEVVDMTETNGKIDALAELLNRSLSFHTETGVYTVDADLTGSQQIKVPCTSGAKVLVFMPDDATKEAILNTTGTAWLVGAVGQVIVKVPNGTKEAYRGHMILMTEESDGSYKPRDKTGTSCNNEDGFLFVCGGIKAGTYNWTAYYWNE